jgi:hypothetical protein
VEVVVTVADANPVVEQHERRVKLAGVVGVEEVHEHPDILGLLRSEVESGIRDGWGGRH